MNGATYEKEKFFAPNGTRTSDLSHCHNTASISQRVVVFIEASNFDSRQGGVAIQMTIDPEAGSYNKTSVPQRGGVCQRSLGDGNTRASLVAKPKVSGNPSHHGRAGTVEK
nr:hypothetical protein BaRGS_001300 [Batillaria attramentaria]